MERETESNGAAESEWLPIPPDLGYGGISNPLPVRRAELWALVLEARFVPCRLENDGAGRTLLVPVGRFAEALDELRLFEEENRDWPPPPAPPGPMAENTLSTLSVLIVVATFHNLTLLHLPLFGHAPIDWIGIGSAGAEQIVD